MTESNSEGYDLLKDVFDLFDLNKDGLITLEELMQVMEWLGENPNPIEVETMFKFFDTNKNGTLEYDEFRDFMSLSVQDGKETDIRIEYLKAFHHFDRNKDGFITASDLSIAVKELGEEVSDKDIQDMMAEAKLDKQGRMTFKSFQHLMKRLEIKEPAKPRKCKCVIL